MILHQTSLLRPVMICIMIFFFVNVTICQFRGNYSVLLTLEKVQRLDLASQHYLMRHAYVQDCPGPLFPAAKSVRLSGVMNEKLVGSIISHHPDSSASTMPNTGDSTWVNRNSLAPRCHFPATSKFGATQDHLPTPYTSSGCLDMPAPLIR